jgi:nitrogenase molybdenum-iron protein alpha/beta subunit
MNVGTLTELERRARLLGLAGLASILWAARSAVLRGALERARQYVAGADLAVLASQDEVEAIERFLKEMLP